jgi:nicotinamide-nucleotide amidase
LLSIGDELLAGDITDTNAVHIASELRRAGVEVVRKSTVRDRLDEICAALEVARDYDICLVTGGLGPTTDDLTATALAAAAGVDLQRDHEVVEALRQRFEGHLKRHAERFGPESAQALIEANLKQADLPKGSTRLDNPVGTAPGFALNFGEGDRRVWVACMPGVPHEMKKMLAEQVLTRVRERFALEAIPRRVYRVLGDGESSVQNRISKVRRLLEEEPRLAGVMLHYRAHTPEILLNFEALRREDGTHANAYDLTLLDEPLGQALGDELFAIGPTELPERIVSSMTAAGLRVATAESCTAGGIAAMLTEAPGSSSVFDGGFITYSNQAKSEWLNVSGELLEAHGAVSREVAEAMALGLHGRTGGDLCVAITGIAGPGGGTPEKPVGTVHVAVASTLPNPNSPSDPAQTTGPRVVHRKLRLRGKRGTVRRSAAVWALKMVFDQLLSAGLATRES